MKKYENFLGGKRLFIYHPLECRESKKKGVFLTWSINSCLLPYWSINSRHKFNEDAFVQTSGKLAPITLK